jgi:hypothetical protein
MKETEGLDSFNYHTTQFETGLKQKRQSRMEALLKKGRRRSHILTLLNFMILGIVFFIIVPKLINRPASTSITSGNGLQFILQAQKMADQTVALLSIKPEETQSFSANTQILTLCFFANNQAEMIHSDEYNLANLTADGQLLSFLLGSNSTKNISLLIVFKDGGQQLMLTSPIN